MVATINRRPDLPRVIPSVPGRRPHTHNAPLTRRPRAIQPPPRMPRRHLKSPTKAQRIPNRCLNLGLRMPRVRHKSTSPLTFVNKSNQATSLSAQNAYIITDKPIEYQTKIRTYRNCRDRRNSSQTTRICRVPNHENTRKTKRPRTYSLRAGQDLGIYGRRGLRDARPFQKQKHPTDHADLHTHRPQSHFNHNSPRPASTLPSNASSRSKLKPAANPPAPSSPPTSAGPPNRPSRVSHQASVSSTVSSNPRHTKPTDRPKDPSTRIIPHLSPPIRPPSPSHIGTSCQGKIPASESTRGSTKTTSAGDLPRWAQARREDPITSIKLAPRLPKPPPASPTALNTLTDPPPKGVVKSEKTNDARSLTSITCTGWSAESDGANTRPRQANLAGQNVNRSV